MYWLGKMDKTSICARFIVAPKNAAFKPLSDTISKISKMIFSTVESLLNKSFFYSGCKNSKSSKILFQLSLS